jgi:hypothetical protein
MEQSRKLQLARAWRKERILFDAAFAENDGARANQHAMQASQIAETYRAESGKRHTDDAVSEIRSLLNVAG